MDDLYDLANTVEMLEREANEAKGEAEKEEFKLFGWQKDLEGNWFLTGRRLA